MKASILTLAVLLVVYTPTNSRAKMFCPLESKANFECRSRSNSFKCGAFFEGLNGDNKPISWIGAMPDLLNKKSTRDNKQFLLSFGLPPTRRSFLFKNETECNAIKANSHCYAFLLKASQTKLDTCDATILNEEGGQPVGDELCKKASFHVGNVDQFNVNIGFFYSSCGEPWTPVNSNGLPLRNIEPICCVNVNGVMKFRRCNGEPYVTSCFGAPGQNGVLN